MNHQFLGYFNSDKSRSYSFHSISFGVSVSAFSVSFTASASASGLSVDNYQRFHINYDLYEC